VLKKRKGDATRICIVNENKRGMLMKITNCLYEGGLNIDQQINKSRGKIAYNVIDIDTNILKQDFTNLHNKISCLEGILSVRIISGNDCEHQSYRAEN
jgi:D-3-phosphoglycerate dehydrogenase